MKLKLLFISVVFIYQINYAQYTDIINSNRPSESMSAFSVGRTVIQLEGGLGFINEKDATFENDLIDYNANGVVADLNFRYGFFKEQLETILEVSYQKDQQEFSTFTKKRDGVKATTIGLKYNIYDPFKYYEENVNLYSWKENQKFRLSQLLPIVAVYGGMNMNFSNNKFLFGAEELAIISPKVMLITQNIFGKQIVFITNTFLDKIGTSGQALGYLLTVTKGFNEKWSAFTEFKGLSNKFYKDNFISAGGAYLVNSNLQVDLSVSKSFKNSPSITYGGVGLTWRSDSNYKDFLVKTPEKNKNDKAKKAKKKKTNDKKMLDRLPTSNEKV